LGVCLLDLRDESVHRKHELIAAGKRTSRQQRASTGGEQVVASSACRTVYLIAAEMREPADVTGAPRVPQRREYVFEYKLVGEVVHVAMQHSQLRLQKEASKPGRADISSPGTATTG